MTQFFDKFFAEVRKTAEWQTMVETVEASEWHREANVAVHTQMCLDFYRQNVAKARTPRQQIMTQMTLLFHDFGKPEAEETVERKDGSGTYHRYAGHEPVSANEFLSFMCEHEELTKSFFAEGFNWTDVRKIKFMIENHLPFGMTNATKRSELRANVHYMLGDDEQCFYDQLWSDCNGRISDDHETKRANCAKWIEEFKALDWSKAIKFPTERAMATMFVLVGPVGAGKSTWVKMIREKYPEQTFVVVSEDNYRMEYAEQNFNEVDLVEWQYMSPAEQYAAAWHYCFVNKGGYEKYANEQLRKAVETKSHIILDRTNQTRKSRAKWVQAAREKKYRIKTVEFYVSERVSHERQATRGDKIVPRDRVHQIYMAFDVPRTSEINSFEIIAPF